jgi:hypothetical protein
VPVSTNLPLAADCQVYLLDAREGSAEQATEAIGRNNSAARHKPMHDEKNEALSKPSQL